MTKEVPQVSPFKALLWSMDTRRGKYRGIYAEVARRLNKPQAVVYTNIAYTEALNVDKKAFLARKAEIDEAWAGFEDLTAKAS